MAEVQATATQGSSSSIEEALLPAKAASRQAAQAILSAGSPARLATSAPPPGWKILNELECGGSTLLDKDVQRVIAFPPANKVAANYNPFRPSVTYLYINGITQGDGKATLRYNLDVLTCALGQPVRAIVNDQDGGFADSRKPSTAMAVLHSGAGLLSSTLGASVESTAAYNLREEMLSAAARGERLHIIAHSQGAIITRNVLFDLRKGWSQQRWDTLCANVEVSTYAARLENWPAGIRVTEYSLSSDMVCAAVHSGSVAGGGARKALKAALRLGEDAARRLGRNDRPSYSYFARADEIPLQKAPSVRLTYNGPHPHNLETAATHIPQFLIARKQSANGSIDSNALASEIICSIQEGKLADKVHIEIIDQRIAAGDQEFLDELEQAKKEGRLGKFEYSTAWAQCLR